MLTKPRFLPGNIPQVSVQKFRKCPSSQTSILNADCFTVNTAPHFFCLMFCQGDLLFIDAFTTEPSLDLVKFQFVLTCVRDCRSEIVWNAGRQTLHAESHTEDSSDKHIFFYNLLPSVETSNGLSPWADPQIRFSQREHPLHLCCRQLFT